MQTVIVTDVKYRSAINIIRSLGELGYDVIAVQTEKDVKCVPAAFYSKYVKKAVMLPCSFFDDDYADILLAKVSEYPQSVLFPVGAVTLSALAKRRDDFRKICFFSVCDHETLEALNDKEKVHARAKELGLCVPEEYCGEPVYPAVVKLVCGEKFGLPAKERYRIVTNADEFCKAKEHFAKYDGKVTVQQKVEGEAYGASLCMANDGRLVSAFCHRRIREYPASGGPSSCCESIYDEKLIASAYKLLSSFGFCGIAMVEFKGENILEVNPRVWGSYSLTRCAGSPFTQRYIQASLGKAPEYPGLDYKVGIRMRFIYNDTLALFDYLKKGDVKTMLGGLRDIFTAKEALMSQGDSKPFIHYLFDTLKGK